jgi:hypothetical protein
MVPILIVINYWSVRTVRDQAPFYPSMACGLTSQRLVSKATEVDVVVIVLNKRMVREKYRMSIGIGIFLCTRESNHSTHTSIIDHLSFDRSRTSFDTDMIVAKDRLVKVFRRDSSIGILKTICTLSNVATV